MILWKEVWYTPNKTYQEKWEKTQIINIKREHHYWFYRYLKNVKGIFWTMFCQHIRKHSWKGQISWKLQLSKTDMMKQKTWIVLHQLQKLNFLWNFSYKLQAQISFAGEFYQTFKVEIVLIIYKHHQNIEEKGILPNHFMRPA